ncbi:MAG: hypothetical protein GON13_01540 [Nanoarchaeota archaeon]|nr:hypothetical protein [Nanoarchaeota archaeon]
MHVNVVENNGEISLDEITEEFKKNKHNNKVAIILHSAEALTKRKESDWENQKVPWPYKEESKSGKCKNRSMTEEFWNYRLPVAINRYDELTRKGLDVTLIVSCGPSLERVIGENGSVKIQYIQGPTVDENGKFQQGDRPYDADIVAKRLNDMGFTGKVFKQLLSLDSVGEIFFPLTYILANDIKWVEGVSSAYHIEGRLNVNYDKIFNNNYQILLHAVPTENNDNIEFLKNNEKTLKTFLEQFKDVPKGNLERFIENFYEKHTLHKKNGKFKEGYPAIQLEF